jgi:peptide/nickel transport system permease protein
MRRVVAGVLVLVAVSMAVFALFFYGPNDPAYQYCPENRCTPAKLEQIHHQMGLDRPAPQQYVEYMSGLVHSRTISEGSLSVECDWPCLGVSFKYKVSVSEYLWERVPATVAVAAGGAICFLALGLVTGIVAARRRGTLADKAIVSSSLIINAVPFYLLALLSFLYLVQRFHLFPPTGYFSPFTDGPLKFVSGMLLPWLMLGIGYATQYARFSRGSMIEALNEDYVRTARAKGLPEGSVVFRHALRAAIVPVVTIFGLDFAGLLTGTVFIEKIFDIQGLGLAGLDAERRVDLPIVAAVVLIGAALIVAAYIVVDIVYTLIDPRVRLT